MAPKSAPAPLPLEQGTCAAHAETDPISVIDLDNPHPPSSSTSSTTSATFSPRTSGRRRGRGGESQKNKKVGEDMVVFMDDSHAHAYALAHARADGNAGKFASGGRRGRVRKRREVRSVSFGSSEARTSSLTPEQQCRPRHSASALRYKRNMPLSQVRPKQSSDFMLDQPPQHINHSTRVGKNATTPTRRKQPSDFMMDTDLPPSRHVHSHAQSRKNTHAIAVFSLPSQKRDTTASTPPATTKFKTSSWSTDSIKPARKPSPSPSSWSSSSSSWAKSRKARAVSPNTLDFSSSASPTKRSAANEWGKKLPSSSSPPCNKPPNQQLDETQKKNKKKKKEEEEEVQDEEIPSPSPFASSTLNRNTNATTNTSNNTPSEITPAACDKPSSLPNSPPAATAKTPAQSPTPKKTSVSFAPSFESPPPLPPATTTPEAKAASVSASFASSRAYAASSSTTSVSNYYRPHHADDEDDDSYNRYKKKRKWSRLFHATRNHGPCTTPRSGKELNDEEEDRKMTPKEAAEARAKAKAGGEVKGCAEEDQQQQKKKKSGYNKVEENGKGKRQNGSKKDKNNETNRVECDTSASMDDEVDMEIHGNTTAPPEKRLKKSHSEKEIQLELDHGSEDEDHSRTQHDHHVIDLSMLSSTLSFQKQSTTEEDVICIDQVAMGHKDDDSDDTMAATMGDDEDGEDDASRDVVMLDDVEDFLDSNGGGEFKNGAVVEGGHVVFMLEDEEEEEHHPTRLDMGSEVVVDHNVVVMLDDEEESDDDIIIDADKEDGNDEFMSMSTHDRRAIRLQKAKQRVLEIFPDVDMSYVETLFDRLDAAAAAAAANMFVAPSSVQGKNADVVVVLDDDEDDQTNNMAGHTGEQETRLSPESEKAMLQQVVGAMLHHLTETPYPKTFLKKVEKGREGQDAQDKAAKDKTNDGWSKDFYSTLSTSTLLAPTTAPATPTKQSPSGKKKKSPSRSGHETKYVCEAVQLLMEDFLFLSKSGASKILNANRGRYAHAYRAVCEALCKGGSSDRTKHAETMTTAQDAAEVASRSRDGENDARKKTFLTPLAYALVLSGSVTSSSDVSGALAAFKPTASQREEMDQVCLASNSKDKARGRSRQAATVKTPRKKKLKAANTNLTVTSALLKEEHKFLQIHLGFATSAIQSILKREQARRLAVETNSAIECNCCFTDCTFDEMCQCREGHLFCMDCLRRYAEEELFGLHKTELKCMAQVGEGGCTGGYDLDQLKRALPLRMVKKLEETRFRNEVGKAAIPDLCTCPKCDFQAILPSPEQIFTCPNSSCKYRSCRHCGEPPHIPLRCSEVEKEAETSQRRHVEEAMTLARVRTCPDCGHKFFKTEGCNKMKCPCGTAICYLCRKKIDGYDHFCNTFDCKRGASCKKCHLHTDSVKEDESAVRRAAEEAAAKALQVGQTSDKEGQFHVDAECESASGLSDSFKSNIHALLKSAGSEENSGSTTGAPANGAGLI